MDETVVTDNDLKKACTCTRFESHVQQNLVEEIRSEGS